MKEFQHSFNLLEHLVISDDLDTFERVTEQIKGSLLLRSRNLISEMPCNHHAWGIKGIKTLRRASSKVVVILHESVFVNQYLSDGSSEVNGSRKYPVPVLPAKQWSHRGLEFNQGSVIGELVCKQKIKEFCS